MICTYNARTVSNNADLHAILGAAERTKLHMIALQEKKTKDMKQMKDGTLIICGEKIP